MNYKESKQILKEIKKAKNILINCHRNPDPDSIGSALALYQVFNKLGKTAKVVSPSPISENFKFLPFTEKIEKVDYKNFDFSKYDLFVSPDSPSWITVVGMSLVDKVPIPKIPIIVIDHHITNERFGKINLVDNKISSSAEVIYLMLEDWGVSLDKNIATSLLAGIIGDTGVFRHFATSAQTLRIAAELMDKGANKDKIVLDIYASLGLELLKFWGEILNRIQVDKAYNFVWSAISYEEFEKYDKQNLKEVKSGAASMFFGNTRGTDFGVLMIEAEKGKLGMSLRARTDVDVSAMAKELGGGGHKRASAAEIRGLPFDEAVEKVLQVARKFAKKK